MYQIFLADDEVWETVGIRKLIERTGLPVEVAGEAENGIAALEGIIKNPPDILITDIRMPGLDGLELVKRIREKGMDLEIILLSGYAEFEYARTAMRWGVKDYLLKPVELEVLKQTLGRIVTEKETARAGTEQGTVGQEESLSVLEQVIQEIQTSYTEDISLSGLAEKYHIGVSRLSIQVKERMGMSFSKYLTSKRIQKAKELLQDEGLSVEQVAEQVGYRDYFYFTKVFKKSTGMSPSRYRKGYGKRE